MARDDTNIVNALNQSEVELWNAVDLKLDNRTLRFWTGTGDRSLGSAINAGQVVIGEQYEIVTTGNTDFTKIGASQNTHLNCDVGIQTSLRKSFVLPRKPKHHNLE